MMTLSKSIAILLIVIILLIIDLSAASSDLTDEEIACIRSKRLSQFGSDFLGLWHYRAEKPISKQHRGLCYVTAALNVLTNNKQFNEFIRDGDFANIQIRERYRYCDAIFELNTALNEFVQHLKSFFEESWKRIIYVDDLSQSIDTAFSKLYICMTNAPDFVSSILPQQLIDTLMIKIMLAAAPGGVNDYLGNKGGAVFDTIIDISLLIQISHLLKHNDQKLISAFAFKAERKNWRFNIKKWSDGFDGPAMCKLTEVTTVKDSEAFGDKIASDFEAVTVSVNIQRPKRKACMHAIAITKQGLNKWIVCDGNVEARCEFSSTAGQTLREVIQTGLQIVERRYMEQCNAFFVDIIMPFGKYKFIIGSVITSL